MPVIDYPTFERAGNNWDKAWGIACGYVSWGGLSGNANGLTYFLGANPQALKWADVGRTLVELPNEEVKRKMELLAGPYYETIIKAWKAIHVK